MRTNSSRKTRNNDQFTHDKSAFLAATGLSAVTLCVLYVNAQFLHTAEHCKSISDQPGRFLAVTVFAPTILHKAWIYKDVQMGVFGVMLWVWDMYWLLNKNPRCTK